MAKMTLYVEIRVDNYHKNQYHENVEFCRNKQHETHLAMRKGGIRVVGQTSFSTYMTARELATLVDQDSFLPAFSSSNIEIYPYQIAAASFALRSPYLKGCILCDEGSLGKTYEALLVAIQKWYLGKDRLLLILPSNLVAQWIKKIESAFNLPYYLWNAGDNIPDEDGLAIVTYDFAVQKADVICEKKWDLVIFDEADLLSKPNNKTVITLKRAIEGAFKLLLTPTPVTMSIMDIYGLIHFIDETVLPDANDFYKRYFRKPENYPELTSWVSAFAFRTLKNQVSDYVNFTYRIPLTLHYELNHIEKELYQMVNDYLARPHKVAYPQMDTYDLTLMFFHILSSSPQGLCKTLNGAIARLSDCEEKNLLLHMKMTAERIPLSGKMYKLVSTLKKCCLRLKKVKIPQKAVIFTDNLTTLGVLAEILMQEGYHVIQNTEEYYIERFRSEKSAVLIATDTAAKGLDMEFCPLVINYDLLYNAVEMEQRINRCHRQGQQSDVLVINFLSERNFSDVRILELINKRVSQFDGIFGMSDEIVGNFDSSIDEVLAQLRSRDEIQSSFDANLVIHESQNKQVVAQAEDTIFTTFTKSVADSIAITPQYIEDKIVTLNDELWQVVCAWFHGRDDYHINYDDKTISFIGTTLPHLFYYWTGSRNRPYTGQKKYGLGANFKPNAGKIVLTSTLVKGILSETACAESGMITVDASIEQCHIALYEVDVISNQELVYSKTVLIGKTQSGKTLDHDECSIILGLPVTHCEETGTPLSYWLRSSTGNPPPHPIDGEVPTNGIIQEFIKNNDSAVADEVERIKLRAAHKKAALEHGLNDIRVEISLIKQRLEDESSDRLKELTLSKKLKLQEKELHKKEEQMFFETMKINVATEDELESLTKKDKYTAQVKRQFIVRVVGRCDNE